MKAKEIRDMTADEARRKVVDLKQELFNLRFQLEVGQLENKARIRQTKQDIARLLTVIRETNPKPQPAKA
ncbi:MAG: 50S ribosomal protein L29 [Desulfobacterales bacterium]|jgi:large subunit ribosomal protein L29|nr:50S ribosomal protein L29 [Desulfobacterales bacterium]